MKHVIAIFFTGVVVLTVVSVAGYASDTSRPSAIASPASIGSTEVNRASASVPTSVNGHDYTYYHNLNDPSTCRLCRGNM